MSDVPWGARHPDQIDHALNLYEPSLALGKKFLCLYCNAHLFEQGEGKSKDSAHVNQADSSVHRETRWYILRQQQALQKFERLGKRPRAWVWLFPNISLEAAVEVQALPEGPGFSPHAETSYR